MTLPFDAAIFDMDGLMFDTERMILWAWQKAMDDFGFPAPLDLYLRSVGLTDEATNTVLVEALGASFPLMDSAQFCASPAAPVDRPLFQATMAQETSAAFLNADDHDHRTTKNSHPPAWRR